MMEAGDDTPGRDLELPSPTAPDNYQISLRGFDNEERARRFGHVVGHAVQHISRMINLERLDGVTIASDYDDALAQLDRGYSSTRPLQRTSDERLLGVAMAPAVLRNGTVKGHMLFYAPAILLLEGEESDNWRQALYLLAHECAHVEDLKDRDEAFPGVILQQQITDHETAILQQVADAVWEEYAACRLSASFGRGQASAYEQGFTSVLGVALREADDAIRSYRQHGDVDRVLSEAGRPLCEPLRLAAYLYGHLDGLEEDLESVPQARDLLANSSYQPFVERLVDVLRKLWSDRGRWNSLSDFQPLRDIGRDVLAAGGLILRPLPGGRLYIDIP
jgi:hypothetical protein